MPAGLVPSPEETANKPEKMDNGGTVPPSSKITKNKDIIMAKYNKKPDLTKTGIVTFLMAAKAVLAAHINLLKTGKPSLEAKVYSNYREILGSGFTPTKGFTKDVIRVLYARKKNREDYLAKNPEAKKINTDAEVLSMAYTMLRMLKQSAVETTVSEENAAEKAAA